MRLTPHQTSTLSPLIGCAQAWPRVKVGGDSLFMVNEIIVNPDGCCTVCGDLAHKLWDYGQGAFPRVKCCRNNFYVFQPPCEDSDIAAAREWDMRAGQSTREGAMRYMDSGRVLVDVTNAPMGRGRTLIEQI